MRTLPLALLLLTILLTLGGKGYNAFVSFFCGLSGLQLLLLRVNLPHNYNRASEWHISRFLGRAIIASLLLGLYSRSQKAPIWAISVCNRICVTCVIQYLLLKLWKIVPTAEFPRSLHIHFSEGLLLIFLSLTTFSLPHRFGTQIVFILTVITGGHDLLEELKLRRLKAEFRSLRTTTEPRPRLTLSSNSPVARERKLKERKELMPKPNLPKPDYKTQLSMWRKELGLPNEDNKNKSHYPLRKPISPPVESSKVREIFSSGRITENLSLNIDWKFGARNYKAISFPQSNTQIPAQYVFTSWDNTTANVFSALTFFGTLGLSSLMHKHYTVHLIFLDQSHEEILKFPGFELGISDSFRKHITQRSVHYSKISAGFMDFDDSATYNIDGDLFKRDLGLFERSFEYTLFMKASAPIQSVYIILFSNLRQPRGTDVSQGFLENLDRDLSDGRVC